MKKRSIILMIAVVIISLVYYFRDPIGALILRSEHIDRMAFMAMMNCIFNPVRRVSVEISGHDYIIPLPDGTARFGTNEYLTPANNFHRYMEEEMTNEGWVYSDRLGSVFVFKRNDNNDKLFVTVMHFTGIYYRFKVQSPADF